MILKARVQKLESSAAAKSQSNLDGPAKIEIYLQESCKKHKIDDAEMTLKEVIGALAAKDDKVAVIFKRGLERLGRQKALVLQDPAVPQGRAEAPDPGDDRSSVHE